jgi:hypothetical protein
MGPFNSCGHIDVLDSIFATFIIGRSIPPGAALTLIPKDQLTVKRSHRKIHCT